MEYINTPFNYTGSKYKLLEQILPEFDYSKKYFIDLFAGGGSIYTNIVTEYNKILVNDIIEDLIGIHKGLLLNNDIIDLVKKLVPEKDKQEDFLNLRKDYNNNKTPAKLWALMLSSTNNMMRFNKKFEYNQTFGKRSFSDATQKKIDIFTEHIRKYNDKLIFTSKNFYDIKPSKPSMVYIDPPYGYIKNGSSIGKKQISEAGYNSYYEQKDDLNLYKYFKDLDNMGNSVMISGVIEHKGNISWILDKLISDGYFYKELNFDYKKVSRKDDGNVTREIIIKNYKND